MMPRGLNFILDDAALEQELKNTEEFGETSEPKQQLLQAAAGIPVVALSRGHSRLTAEALKNRFLAQLDLQVFLIYIFFCSYNPWPPPLTEIYNEQNSILEQEHKLTALMHAKELTLAQQSVHEVIQHWKEIRDAKTLIDKIANEEQLQKQRQVSKQELEMERAEHEKLLKASEKKRYITVALATEALTAANNTLCAKINALPPSVGCQSCGVYLGEDEREQELTSVLHDGEFIAGKGT